MLNILMVFTIAVLAGWLPGSQDDFTPFLTRGTPIDLRLTGSDELSVRFEAESGDVISLMAMAQSPESLDLVLSLIAPDGERLAYNDDWAGGRESAPGLSFGLAATDPALLGVRLTQAGTYTALIGSFNREQTGEFQLTLSIAEPVVLRVDVESVTVELARGAVMQIPLELSAGQRVTITAADPNGLRDLHLTILDADGTARTLNDDHGTLDVSLNIFDARLTYTASADATVTVQLREFLGRAVQAQVWVTSAP